MQLTFWIDGGEKMNIVALQGSNSQATLTNTQPADQHNDKPNGTDSKSPNQMSEIDKEKMKNTISQLNKDIQPNTEIVFKFDQNSHRIWLNVIDKTTGKTVGEIPPEIIRKLEDSYMNTFGLLVDKKM